MEQCKIVNMYDLNETIAKEYMETAEYPWELLDGLSDYIKRLGDTLDPEKYEKRGEDVFEAELNDQITDLKTAAKEKVKKHEDVIKINEALIQQYTTEHKDELKGKSKKLAFGTLGFRLSTKLILPKAIKTVIESLQRNGMMDCLTTKVTVNKEVLKTYDEAEILNVGASLKREDTFWYETDRHTVQDE